MPENERMQLFEDQPIRTAWDEQQEEWYFSVVDVVGVLTESREPRRYWSDLKRKLKAEGATQLYENIVQLKLLSSDGKRYKTDVATTEQLLRKFPKCKSRTVLIKTARSHGKEAKLQKLRGKVLNSLPVRQSSPAKTPLS